MSELVGVRVSPGWGSCGAALPGIHDNSRFVSPGYSGFTFACRRNCTHPEKQLPGGCAVPHCNHRVVGWARKLLTCRAGGTSMEKFALWVIVFALACGLAFAQADSPQSTQPARQPAATSQSSASTSTAPGSGTTTLA